MSFAMQHIPHGERRGLSAKHPRAAKLPSFSRSVRGRAAGAVRLAARLELPVSGLVSRFLATCGRLRVGDEPSLMHEIPQPWRALMVTGRTGEGQTPCDPDTPIAGASRGRIGGRGTANSAGEITGRDGKCEWPHAGVRCPAPHTAAAIAHPATSFAGRHRAGEGRAGSSPGPGCGPRCGAAVRVMTDVNPDMSVSSLTCGGWAWCLAAALFEGPTWNSRLN